MNSLWPQFRGLVWSPLKEKALVPRGSLLTSLRSSSSSSSRFPLLQPHPHLLHARQPLPALSLLPPCRQLHDFYCSTRALLIAPSGTRCFSGAKNQRGKNFARVRKEAAEKSKRLQAQLVDHARHIKEKGGKPKEAPKLHFTPSQKKTVGIAGVKKRF
ncbi:unnamed protein product [Amoebophrya sp. A25]|nr:unnamed protein product [Amoebophrya sp. A25]|eukprot:GSA25T00008767001.1